MVSDLGTKIRTGRRSNRVNTSGSQRHAVDKCVRLFLYQYIFVARLATTAAISISFFLALLTSSTYAGHPLFNLCAATCLPSIDFLFFSLRHHTLPSFSSPLPCLISLALCFPVDCPRARLRFLGSFACGDFARVNRLSTKATASALTSTSASAPTVASILAVALPPHAQPSCPSSQATTRIAARRAAPFPFRSVAFRVVQPDLPRYNGVRAHCRCRWRRCCHGRDAAFIVAAGAASRNGPAGRAGLAFHASAVANAVAVAIGRAVRPFSGRGRAHARSSWGSRRTVRGFKMGRETSRSDPCYSPLRVGAAVAGSGTQWRGSVGI